MFKEKYDQMANKIHECIVCQFTEEETKWYELYCRIHEAYEREQALLNSACATLMREEADAEREKATSCQ